MAAKHDRKRPKGTLEAGMLSTVLAVSLIIATLCASLILLAYYYRTSTVQHTLAQRLNNNAQSGINLLLATTDKRALADKNIVDLFGRGQDSVGLWQKPWGLYQVAIAQAQVGRHGEEKIALVGRYPNPLGKAALYLSDEQRPLSIAGDTQLTGTCYLPKAGIKSAYVNRIGYQGEQLVNGSTKESQPSLPTLSEDALRHFRTLLSFSTEAYQVLPSLPDSLMHSFVTVPLYHHRAAPITLSGTLKGNIIVASDQAVTITPQANIDGLIVTAPQVIIEQGFSGRLQVLATDTLLVNSNCHLRYPSALVLLSSAGALLLEESSQLEGTVVVGRNQLASDYHQRLLKIGGRATVTGMVYADGLVELKGSIHGHLSGRKFVLRTPSTLYENHILNGTIDASACSPHYLASSLWGVSNQKGIVQWLY